MFWPEKLYALLSADKGKFPLQPLIRRAQTDQAAASVLSSITNNFDGRALLLYNACTTGSAGGALTISWARIDLVSPTGDASAVTAALEGLTFAPAGIQGWGLTWKGGVIVPPLWTVRAQMVFSAGTSSNQNLLDIHGCLIPRGTFTF